MSEIKSFTGEINSNTPPERGRRDWGALFAIVVTAAALFSLGWLEYVAWQKLGYAQETLQRARSGSLSSGVEIQEGLGSLKLSLLLFQVSGEEGNRQQFSAEARRVAALVGEAEVAATTEEERSVVIELKNDLAAFMERAEKFEPVKALRRGAVERLTAEIDSALQPARLAAEKLAARQSETRTQLEQSSATAFGSTRNALRSSLLALVVLLGAVGMLVYRSFLVPLQMRLDATVAESNRRQQMASIGVLATGVAHEIRNPLTAIKFRLFSLKKSLGTELSSNEDFQTIRSEIDRLENLVKSFLEFARPAEPQRVELNAAELLEEVRRLLEPEMSRKNVILQVDAAEVLAFRGDRQQLRQVLINLAQNAGDSMPEGGTVVLRAHRGMAVLENKREPAVMLEITDTGTGIDPETQKRLFDPFFSTKEGGTGLGLAIAARIVEQHGGGMQFSSRKNEGSTFTAILPLERADSKLSE